MGYLATNGFNNHQLPRFQEPRLKLVEVKKTSEKPVERWVMAFFDFTFEIVGKKEVMSVPYNYDDGEWLLRAASCAVTFPIELRADAMTIINGYNPFSCP